MSAMPKLLRRKLMAKSLRRKGDNVVSMPAAASPHNALAGLEVTDGDIARRAFDLYCARGQQDGHDIDDWLSAERELRTGVSSTAA